LGCPRFRQSWRRKKRGDKVAGTKDTSKRAVGLRVAPATLAQVEDLRRWLGAPSATWVWEGAIQRWHAIEQARREAERQAAGEVAELGE